MDKMQWIKDFAKRLPSCLSAALSCEELNKDAGVECVWKYNACGSACPRTCQHPEPLNCPVTCVDGCHAVCPAGSSNSHVLKSAS